MKYSAIKRLLNIEPLKDDSNAQAFTTHFLYNSDSQNAEYFREPAITYLTNRMDLEEVLPLPRLSINWDIPFPAPLNPKFTFVDLFAGIGGMRIAFQKHHGKCVFSSEWDKFSKYTYETNFGEVPFGDITKIDENMIPDHDVLVAGFPCQPFSIAGVSKKNSLGRSHGFLDQTQGTLFFDIARILQAKRPRLFLLENVKNLLSHDKGRTFKVISETLQELGYYIFYKVMDGKYYVPQHRERILIVGFNLDYYSKTVRFNFPEKSNTPPPLYNILENEPDSKYTLSDHLWKYLQDYADKHKKKGNGFGYGLADFNGITRTLSARYYKDGSEILLPQPGMNPRRLTPRECARLQGFPDKFRIPVSDNQAYRQFGNSVVVPLISDVAKNLTRYLYNE